VRRLNPDIAWTLLVGSTVWAVALWSAFGCAYAHGPQGTSIAFGDAHARSTAKTCSADGGTISDNARLLVAQAVAAGVKAAIGGGVPSIGDLLPAMTPATPPAVVENPVVVVPPDAVIPVP